MSATMPERLDAHRDGGRTRSSIELQSVLAAGGAGAVAFLVGLVMLWGEVHPLSGDGSVAQVAAFTTGGAAAASFAVAYIRSDQELPWLGRRFGWMLRIGSSLAIGLVCFGLGYLGATSAGQIFQQGFVGLEMDAFGGAIACAIAGGAAAYLAHPLGHDVSTATLAGLVPTFLVVGVLFSMLTASDPDWWQLHFSQLGAGAGLSGIAFNATLVLSGVLVATLGAYVHGDLDAIAQRATGTRHRPHPEWVGRLLAGIGACMSLTGLVTVVDSEPLHIVFASGMVVLFGILCLALPLIAPRLPRSVHIVSAAMVAGTIVALVLWVPVGYYNFTGFELAACGLIFVWLSAFVRAIAAAAADRAGIDGPVGSTSEPAAGRVGA